ncbi:MAG: UMP kinase [Clostridiales bacterium]|nr:UMP kinase [Clostridiales bacterium]
MAVYKRVLFKLSGEALKSGADLFDFDKVRETAEIIREMHDLGVEIGVVIGAGNIWRGRQGPAANMDAVTADQMGMLGTVINCLCVADALRKAGMDVIVQSAVDMTRFCEPFNAMAARRHLSEGRIVLFAAGSGNPFFSTDTAVALRAIEMQADAILMAKNIDGVYTADPNKDPSATLIKDITYREALARGLKVMDAAAFALCAENDLPMVRVFGLDDPKNLIKVLEGSDIGTFVHP